MLKLLNQKTHNTLHFMLTVLLLKTKMKKGEKKKRAANHTCICAAQERGEDELLT